MTFSGYHLDFSTNDYLNLSKNPKILEAAYEAGRKYGCGSTGSRLLSGNKQIFCEFEEQIAIDKHTEAALIFGSGYQANLTVLSALCDEKTLGHRSAVLFFDKLNHASLYKAAELCRGKLERYSNNDVKMLETALMKYRNIDCAKFIVSETVFGMDGSCANLPELIRLAEEHDALIYLDEAHATGVFGRRGYGLSTNYDFGDVDCCVMGTFGKALGVSGAYVACPNQIRNYLLQKCSGFIYSTAPSPLIIGAARKSWELVGKMDEERAKLLELSAYLRNSLNRNGISTMNSTSHIIPVRMKSSADATKCRDFLLERGILTSAVRPPSAPTPRLRFALTAKHSRNEIDLLFSLLCNWREKRKI